MVTPPCGGQPETQDLGSKLDDIVTAARRQLTNAEIKGLEELTEYEDIFAEADEDYGRTNKVYHHKYGRRPNNSPATEENTTGETNGGKGDAGQNATT
jgi:hypothetical protein